MGKNIKKHKSATRKIIDRTRYKSFKTLDEAKKYKNSYIIMEGDYGGQIYLTIPTKQAKCSSKNLKILLNWIDKRVWDNNGGASIYYEEFLPGDIIGGGMGGALAKNNLWLHENINELKKIITLFIKGKINVLPK